MDNKNAIIYTLENKNSIKVLITNYGGRIMSLLVPDKKGNLIDVVLGYDTLEETLNGDSYFGAIIGRYANRIAQGKFCYEGKIYQLKTNNYPHALHGGEIGYNHINWNAKQEGNKLILNHLDKEGHEHYSGNVNVQVIYELTDNDELIIYYLAKTDAATPINLTNHAYFNLNGEGSGSICQHKLKINADYFTPIDETLIPTGEIRKVVHTPFDFREFKDIGENINQENLQINYANGYDHNFVLNGKGDKIKLAAEVIAPNTGIKMDVLTTEPGVQFYTSNFLELNKKGKKGHMYGKRSAFCLETQHYPDSPNKANFPNTILRPGKVFESKTIYKFGIVN